MTSVQVEEWLRQGIAAARAGDTENAYELLLKVVDVDEYNEQAWLWLSSVVESDADREVCLENVLAINPENKVAKAGLVHLHSKAAELAAAAETLPEPVSRSEPTPAEFAAEEYLQALQSDWWDEPETLEGAVEAADSWEAQPASEKALTVEIGEGRLGWRGVQATGRRIRALLQSLVAPAFLLLGLLAGALAIMAILRLDLFDSAKQDYADAMQPLWEEYDAWWKGPEGALINELNRPCGPGADGWRNWDVLVVCSERQSAVCSHVINQCGSDFEAMRERVYEWSQEAGQAGETLLASFEAVSPPDGISSAHEQFLACLRTRVADAGRIARLTRGEPISQTDYTPTCQMFSTAEAEVQAYINSQ